MIHFPILEPRKYGSPSGEFTLQIDPSDPYGSGPSMVTVKRGGQQVWSGKRPWTLWAACIADDGVVGGVAYTQGVQGMGEFVVVLLTPRGETLGEKRVKRRGPRHFDSPNEPRVDGVFFHPDNGRFVVRVDSADRRSDEDVWWSFSVATGKQMESFTPKGDGRWVIDARPVPATPLTLLHWWRFDSGQVGATFTLVDAAGKTVWRRTLPDDYEVPGDEDAADKLRDEIREKGAILKTGPHAFTLRHVAAKQAVTYTVARDGAGWSVRETARVPFIPAEPRKIVFAAPEIRPTLQATLTLHAPATGAPPPIRDIDAPVAAGPGRIAFLRYGDDPALVVVRDTGEVLHTCRLKADALLWRGADRFLAFVADPKATDPERCTTALQVDARTGATAPLKDFRCPTLDSVAPCPGGGFVVLGTIREKYTMSDALIAYDDQGKARWTKDNRGGYRDTDGPETLFSPKAMAVLRDGTVAVLDVIQHTVQLFAADGRYRKTIALDKAWKRKAEYPADIFATPDGGFVVFDFPGAPSVYWMGAAGNVVRSHSLHFPGATPGTSAILAMGHDGRLWVNNRYCLFRLDASGRADRRLGEPPAADALRAIAALTVLDDGSILAQDERTGAVHVFGAAGKWRAVCKPFRRVPETQDDLRGAALEPGPGATFAVGERWFTTAGRAIARPRGFRTAGERAARIKRRPDNTWLAEWFRRRAAAAPNGALVVADGRLNLYAANDAPERLIPLPEAFVDYPIAYDGATIVLGGPDAVYAYAANGRPKWRLSVSNPAGRERNWTPFLIDGGRALCLFDGVRTVYRYGL